MPTGGVLLWPTVTQEVVMTQSPKYHAARPRISPDAGCDASREIPDVASFVALLLTIRQCIQLYRGASQCERDGQTVIYTTIPHPSLDESAESSTRRPIASDGGEPLFDSRETESGLIVIADLQGVVRNDHATEVDLADDSLVLTIDDRFVWRVPIEDDRTTITDVSLTNDILEARIDVGE